MKRKILISTLLFLTGLVTHAQDLDIKPSQQAQGILESKNGMVDHATGLFHYKVPLYEVKSGNFILPISLNYVAKGVKVNDNAGLVGYNWSLNTGGVVTRTIRGGIADETQNGYARNSHSEFPTTAEIELVNKREKDGESDIFTANFNGKTINFVINIEGGNIIVIPLEKTNVKIECATNNLLWLDAWTITDDNGDKYIFKQKEITKDVVKNDAISFNGIRNESYTSSWYLSSIEPLNSNSIIYKYYSEPLISKYSFSFKSKYQYGKALVNNSFNFKKYQDRFNDAIQSAIDAISDSNNKLRLKNSKYSLEVQYGFYTLVENPDYDLINDIAKENIKIMGILSSIESLANVSNELFTLLNDLYDIYIITNYQVAAYLQTAESLLYSCIREQEFILEKEVSNNTAYIIEAPKLQSISYNDKKILFDYKYNDLSEIREVDFLNNNISKIGMDRTNGKLLSKIAYYDKNNSAINNISFEYYGTNLNRNNSDIWGFAMKEDNRPNVKYSALTNIEYAKSYSLKSIDVGNNSKITIDYESNTLDPSQFYSYLDGDQVIDYKNGDEYIYGGIRLKKIVYSDESNLSSTINYKYPLPGRTPSPIILNKENLVHSTFTDHIKYSCVKYALNQILQFGNNGVYYSYIEEEIEGKGMNTYLFENWGSTDQFLNVSNVELLSSAIFDENKKLIKIIKNEYYLIDNLGTLPQIKINENYINKTKVETYYRNQGQITIGGLIFNPFEKVYTPNILPRIGGNTSIFPPDYFIPYGGAKLLKEQLVYDFGGGINIPPSIDIFTMDIDQEKYSRETYDYDNNLNNIYPTRITKELSNGDELIMINKRVIDMSNEADPIFSTMRSKNILNKVIKTQTLTKPLNESNYKLINEKIYRYGISNGKHIAVNQVYDYSSDDIKYISLPPLFPDNVLFTFGENNYKVSDQFIYENLNGNYLPVYHEEREKNTAIHYNFDGTQTIAKGYNINNKSSAFVDYNKFITIDFATNDFICQARKIADKFFENYTSLNIDNCSAAFRNYAATTEHKNIIKIIKNFKFKEARLSYSEIKSLLNNTITVNSITTFTDKYINEFPILSTDEYSHIGILKTEYLLYDLNELLDPVMYDYMNTLDKSDIIQITDQIRKSSELKITNTNSINQFKLLIVANTEESYLETYLNVEVSHSGGISEEEIFLSKKSGYKLYINDLNLNSYNGISSIVIKNIPFEIKYIALVPADAEFEATSYNADGTVFCKFNQNGQLERYEYDAAGRVKKIFDNDNNVLKEFNYNVVLPQ